MAQPSGVRSPHDLYEPNEESLSLKESLALEADICRALFPSQETRSKFTPQSYLCFICMKDEAASTGIALPCGHMVCNECLVSFLAEKINEGNAKICCVHRTSSSTFLADNGQLLGRNTISSSGSTEGVSDDLRNAGLQDSVCGAEISEEIVRKVLRDPEVLQRYLHMKDTPADVSALDDAAIDKS